MTSQRSYSGDAASECGYCNGTGVTDVSDCGQIKPCTECDGTGKAASAPDTSLTHAARAEPVACAHKDTLASLGSRQPHVTDPCAMWPVSRAKWDDNYVLLYAEPSLTHAYAEGRADEREEAESAVHPAEHRALLECADAFERSADWLDKGALTGSQRTHPLVGTRDYRTAAIAIRRLVALSYSPSPAREEATTEREEAKKARPPSDVEPWVVADDTGVRVTFSTEDAAWRYRNEYTNRLENPTVTHEPAREEAGEDARDAARWRAVASAVSELTLMLHYSRPDQRASIVDAALAADQMNKEHGNAPAA
jgi:hypothetical protein